MTDEDPLNLEHFLAGAGVPFEFISKAMTMNTAETALRTGIPLFQITKSLVCLANDGHAYVAIIPGDHTVALKHVARTFGARKARLCPAEAACSYSGYAPGTTPPLHYRRINGVVMDERLQQLEWLYGGGGMNARIVKLRTEDVIRINAARIEDIALPPDT